MAFKLGPHLMVAENMREGSEQFVTVVPYNSYQKCKVPLRVSLKGSIGILGFRGSYKTRYDVLQNTLRLLQATLGSGMFNQRRR